MFGVIRVSMDCDHVEEVSWVKGFPSRKEAEEYIEILKLIDKESVEHRLQYNKEFLENLEIPSDPEGWDKFIKTFNGYWKNYTPGSFKTQFAIYVGNVKFESIGYNPPLVTWDGCDLYIVEVK